MWLLAQMAIMIAIGWTGIYYKWTPNGYLLGLLAVGGAFVVTWLLTKGQDRAS